DSCGAGRYRGGLGLRRSYRLLADSAVLQLRADRLRFAPYGLAGGEPGAPSGNWLGEGNAKRALPGKVTMTVARGDLVTHHQAGGGGHGDPLARDPDAVAADVWNGKITAFYAARHHAVAVDSQTGTLDRSATLQLRRQRSVAT
ncbi:MAG TPA: hydantoinase B/oxoprolinase family protein, partial [Rhodopila sp.]